MSRPPMVMSNEYEALLQFVYMAPVGLAQLSMNGDIVMANPVAAQLLLPLSRDADLANLFNVLNQVAPDLQTLVSEFDRSSGVVCDGMRIQLSTGARKSAPQMLALTLLRLDEFRLMSVLSDITEQVKRERALRQNEAWLSAILTDITDYALVSLDDRGCVRGWNSGIGRVTGYEPDALLGEPYSIFYPPGGTTPERVLDRLHEADENGWSLDEGWRQKADGSRFWGNALITPVQTLKRDGIDSESPAYCLVIRDITDKREASEKARRDTSCDYLTGIGNRRSLYEAGEVEIARWKRAPRPLSLIVFDADHFKLINDSHGHPAGDAVLRHLAGILTATFRPCDVVARVGGEEFAVLLPSTELSAAVTLANDLLKAVSSSMVTGSSGDIRYTVSAGVAAMNAQVSDLDDLMTAADLALYAAKRAGRNQVAQLCP